MADPPAWLPLADALRRLVALGRPDAEAKKAICQAIAELRLRVALVIESESGARETIDAAERIEIPAPLTPQDLDWAASRPTAAAWRIRSDTAPGIWEARRVARLEVNADDFAVALCGDLASIPLPDRPRPIDVGTASATRERGRAAPSASDWAPWAATLAALEGLAEREAIPLSEAVSILAFASPAEPTGGDEREYAARRRQALRALDRAATLGDVVLSASRTPRDARNERIPLDAFLDPLRLGRESNSLESGFDDESARPIGDLPRAVENEANALSALAPGAEVRSRGPPDCASGNG